MNRTRGAAERHIADSESRIARHSATVEAPPLMPAMCAEGVAPLASWETPAMRIAQLAWGEGCSKPGDASYVSSLAGTLDLDSTKTVMEFGAGLGADARALHRRCGARIVGYETDGAFAAAARRLSASAGLEKAVEIVRYSPREFAPSRDSYDCILSRETLFQIERKDEALIKMELALKPRGQVVLTDFVLNPGIAADDARLRSLIPGPVFFWTASRYGHHFRERNFDLRASEDVTAAYRKLVIDGCKRYAEGGRDFVANAKAYPDAMAAFLKLCQARVTAFDSGLLQVRRFAAVKLSGPRLMSDW